MHLINWSPGTQKQAMLVRQLEEELRLRMRQPNLEMQQQMEAIYAENDHLQREISILRETIKDLECRVETQKQTLIARDESIKKLLEMLQAKGMGKSRTLKGEGQMYTYIDTCHIWLQAKRRSAKCSSKCRRWHRNR